MWPGPDAKRLSILRSLLYIVKGILNVLYGTTGAKDCEKSGQGGGKSVVGRERRMRRFPGDGEFPSDEIFQSAEEFPANGAFPDNKKVPEAL